MEPQADGTLVGAGQNRLRKLAPGRKRCVLLPTPSTAEVAGNWRGGITALALQPGGRRFATRRSSRRVRCPCRPTLAGNARARRTRPRGLPDRPRRETRGARSPAPNRVAPFDEALIAALTGAGIACTFVTLHGGAGTFLPVTVDDVTTHRMHGRMGRRSGKRAADEIPTQPAAAGGCGSFPWAQPLLRLIETARGTRMAPLRPISRGIPTIFIYPATRWKVTDAL